MRPLVYRCIYSGEGFTRSSIELFCSEERSTRLYIELFYPRGRWTLTDIGVLDLELVVQTGNRA